MLVILAKLKVDHWRKRLLTISNSEHSGLIDCMRQLYPGAICVEIYKWDQRD